MPKKLRQGFTTGTAAAAAAKGAVMYLLQALPPREVSVELLTGDRISIPIRLPPRQTQERFLHRHQRP
jgi:cobalt-precorrin-5B (C1)-methyltransferase